MTDSGLARAQPEPTASVRAYPELPEVASVWWRPRITEVRLRRTDRVWTLVALAHSVPFVAAAIALSVLKPVTIPIGLVLLAHAWAIPELYAARGAGVVRSPRRRAAATNDQAEATAIGLLGDLLGHRARELRARTGLVIERSRLGVWLLGPTGALLVRPGGRRVHCYCVRASDPELPPSDRTAHLLLALREDEAGFATVSNLVFAGATWRLRRRSEARVRQAVVQAVAEARAMRSSGT